MVVAPRTTGRQNERGGGFSPTLAPVEGLKDKLLLTGMQVKVINHAHAVKFL